MFSLFLVVVWCLTALPPVLYVVLKVRLARHARSNKLAGRPGEAVRLAVPASVWAITIGFVLWLITWLVDVWVASLWFDDVGYSGRYWTQFWTQLTLFWITFALVSAFYLANARTLLRLVNLVGEKSKMIFQIVAPIVCCAGGLHFAFDAENYWDRLQMFLHGQPFGKHDPVFSKDIGFYVFTLPFLDNVMMFIYHVLRTAIVVVLIFYSTAWFIQWRGDKTKQQSIRRIREIAAQHLAALGALVLANEAVETFLDRYDVLYSPHGHVYGAGWADLFVRIPVCWILIAVLLICIAWVLASLLYMSPRRAIRNSLLAFVTVFALEFLGTKVVPDAFQSAYVDPNELQVEKPYIQREVDFTRAAFGLDAVRQFDFPVKDGLTSPNLIEDAETLESARLWDWNVLLSINHQLQAFRPYYSFGDVDIVRYDIHGKKVQLMYSGRELDVDKLPESAQTFQNTRLVYTHGYGGTANPVNTFTSEGLPDYWVKGFPPVSRYPEMEIKQPRIYFGEATQQHIYVNTKMQEFDYPDPIGGGNQWFHYDGPAGIRLGGWFRRLAIAWVYDGLWMTWSNELTSESRLLAGRDIKSRTGDILPSLWAEQDIYQVIADGQLWYMRDFETTSAWYPYSRPQNGVNYVRNSVKAVVNAYTGKTDFYVFDPDDPIIRAYQVIFPGLFKPASAMPAYLRKHVRYPEGLFQIQSDVYASYHMRDAVSFYNKDDVWQQAMQFAPSINESEWVLPYYVVMKLPGNEKREYVLMVPFTPLSTDTQHQRNNLESMLVARCDGEHYGELMLYKFPNTRQVQGPLQVGGKLNQDPEMSKNFTQWNQQGSKVVLGDMRVIPLSDYRLLTVQAIYLQSEGTAVRMPQLMYVVAASGDQVVYEKTFQQALNRLVGVSPTVIQPATGVGTQQNPTNITQDIIERLEKYFSLLQQGQFAEAGSELQAIRGQLKRSKEAGKVR